MRSATTDEEDVLSHVLGEIGDEFSEKVLREMFHCVKSKAGEGKLIHQPHRPLFDLGFHLDIRIFQTL
jgi:hypothetical protein